MTDHELETLLNRGYETNGVEFKGAGKRTDFGFLAKVIPAIIDMANRRDGGVVVIGVDFRALDPVGLESDQLDTWGYDNVSTSVNQYANPSVSFELGTNLLTGKKLVVMEADEFANIPILCARDAHPPNVKSTLILRREACYVRSRHKPETSEIPSEEEMRDLLELAIDKGVKKFAARAENTGMFPRRQTPHPLPSDEDLFKKQMEDLA